ncbi:MAG TPA: hypothetical protein VFB04_16075 [Terriglobales bacterium]|nr:hypothetical protein [Terriglobales bacterium]
MPHLREVIFKVWIDQPSSPPQHIVFKQGGDKPSKPEINCMVGRLDGRLPHGYADELDRKTEVTHNQQSERFPRRLTQANDIDQHN